MPKSVVVQLDGLMRKLHLWTGLFLVPWMLVYATSAFLINHPGLVKRLGNTPPTWEQVKSFEFAPNDAFPSEPKEQALVILAEAGLEGAYRIQGSPNPNQMIIMRMRGSGHYRVTWQKKQQRVLVEQQAPFSMIRLVHFLHFRSGYSQPVGTYIAWAAIVDLVAFSFVLWVVSGIYLWARMKRNRLSGGVCLATGCVLFVVLVLLLCR